MSTYCGADCSICQFHEGCKGCAETLGHPFGGACVAAEYCKVGGKEAYAAFKDTLLFEINALLVREGVPEADKLYELCGSYVNLSYSVPSGESVKFLDDMKIYLGCQIEIPGGAGCIGVVADTTFILICRYGLNGSNPELVLYKRR